MKIAGKRVVNYARLGAVVAGLVVLHRLLSSGSAFHSSVISLIATGAFCLTVVAGARALPVVAVSCVLATLLWDPEATPLIASLVVVYALVYAMAVPITTSVHGTRTPWLTSDRSAFVFLSAAFVVPLITAFLTVLVTRLWFPSDVVDYGQSGGFRAFDSTLLLHVIRQWSKECAGFLAIGPLLLVCGPALIGVAEDELPGVLPAHWVEITLHTLAAPILIGLAISLKSRFGLNAVYLTPLPVLSISRHGIVPTAVTLAAMSLSVSAAWLTFPSWREYLDEAGFRTLLISICAPAVLLACVAEQRKHFIAGLESVESRFRSLAVHTRVIREDEGQRVHQTIAARLRPPLDSIRAALRRARMHSNFRDTAGFEHETRAASQTVDQLMVEVRRLATEIRPSVLDALGLEAGIEWLAKESLHQHGVPVIVRCAEPVQPEPHVATVYFRTVQDFLRWMFRRPRTTDNRVIVSLDRVGKELVLKIDSDEPLATPDVELLALKERIERIGGSLRITGNGHGDITGLVAHSRDRVG